MSLAGWSKKLELMLDSSKIDENLTNFPVLITLSSGTGQTSFDATGVFDELAISGSSNVNRKRIAVTTTISGVETELYVEIERWDHENEQAYLWTKVPTIASGTNTQLFLYYDKDHVDNDEYVGDTGDAAQSVWDSNFKTVYHMAQDPNGDPPDAIKDSTSNVNHGTPVGSMTSADLVDGEIGKAIDFDGNDDCIDTGISDVNAPYTFEIVCYTNQSLTRQLLIENFNSSVNDVFFELDGSGSVMTYADVLGDQIVGSYTNNEWMYLTMTVDSLNGVQLYKSGIFIDSVKSGSNTDFNSGANYIIGSRPGDTTFNNFNGKICDVRFSNILRSTSWIRATYYSNWDNLVTYSSPLYYFSGYVFEGENPVSRTLYLHDRSNGSLINTTTSSGNGYYYVETIFPSAHYIVCLDNEVGEDFNDMILGNMFPITVSG